MVRGMVTGVLKGVVTGPTGCGGGAATLIVIGTRADVPPGPLADTDRPAVVAHALLGVKITEGEPWTGDTVAVPFCSPDVAKLSHLPLTDKGMVIGVM